MSNHKVIMIESDNQHRSDRPLDMEIVHRILVKSSTPIQSVTLEQELTSLLSQQEVNAFWIDGKLVEDTGLQTLLNQTGLPVYLDGNLLGKQDSGLSLGIKRAIDICLSVIGLLVTGVVILVVYPIVQYQSPGNIFFVQERVGKNGKRFKMYKLRSMYLDAEERKKDLLAYNEVNSELMFKLENDPRIFPFGQKMRSWSIDELPQFLNVLKGDMSLIGTRPPTVDEVSNYKLHHFKRLAMKPGITGMWQVSGRSNITDFEEVVKLDGSYIDNWSLWLDVKIFFKTIKVILLKEGSK